MNICFGPCDCFQGYQQAEKSRQSSGRGQNTCGLGSEGALESSQDMHWDEKRMAWESGLPGAGRYFPMSVRARACVVCVCVLLSHFTSTTLRGYA